MTGDGPGTADAGAGTAGVGAAGAGTAGVGAAVTGAGAGSDGMTVGGTTGWAGARLATDVGMTSTSGGREGRGGGAGTTALCVEEDEEGALRFFDDADAFEVLATTESDGFRAPGTGGAGATATDGATIRTCVTAGSTAPDPRTHFKLCAPGMSAIFSTTFICLRSSRCGIVGIEAYVEDIQNNERPESVPQPLHDPPARSDPPTAHGPSQTG